MRLHPKQNAYTDAVFPDTLRVTATDGTTYKFDYEPDWPRKDVRFYQLRHHPAPFFTFSENEKSVILTDINLWSGSIGRPVINKGIGRQVIERLAAYARKNKKSFVIQETKNYFLLQLAYRLDPNAVFFPYDTSFGQKHPFPSARFATLREMNRYASLDIEIQLDDAPEAFAITGKLSEVVPGPKSFTRNNFIVRSDATNRITVVEMCNGKEKNHPIGGIYLQRFIFDIVLFNPARVS